ncbi:AraC family transcriptional regulator [Maricurvus nonylphenolicus]|uniref:AraC family transcriptional regulator n=1 Tax=Maricurvus nonylphenolicus TaxID=1008307 RepID=UPI0036F315B8
MASIALDAVRSLVNYLSARGMDRQQLLSTINVSEEQLCQTGQLMPTSVYDQLFELGEKQLNNPMLGFEFGQDIEPDRWGVLGYIAYTASTLAEAQGSQRKYQSLVGNLGTPTTEPQGEQLLLRWIPSYPCSHHTAEEILTGWIALSRKLAIEPTHVDAVYFSHGCQGDIEKYQRYFDCDLQFGHDFNGILINKAVLDVPLGKSNQDIHRLLCEQAEQQISKLVEQLPIETITQFISNQLPLGVPDINDAASSLHMSVRTLQRKLAEHELSFSGLVDSIRQDLAIRYLTDTDTKAIYISQMLGFSEQSAFQRAFKRWTGQTPKQYREQLSP